MAQVIIPNPVLNSPFDEPGRHFYFNEDGITDKVVESRRLSSYFVPVPKPKKKGAQLALDTEWTQDRIEENKFINEVRTTIAKWRFGGHSGVTTITRQLLEYWTDPTRERRLFFCQIEALETAIYLTEIADRKGGAWILRQLKEANQAHSPLLNRIAFKMATGSGKTVVMARLIAWHTLNKLAAPHNARFGDAFLIVTPGITIRYRLRVLLPNDPGNYYRQLDVVPELLREPLAHAKILITNYLEMAVGILHRAGRRLAEALPEMDGRQQEQAQRQIESARRELDRMATRIGKEQETQHAESGTTHRDSGTECEGRDQARDRTRTTTLAPDCAQSAALKLQPSAGNPTGGESRTLPPTDPGSVGFLQGESRAKCVSLLLRTYHLRASCKTRAGRNRVRWQTKSI